MGSDRKDAGDNGLMQQHNGENFSVGLKHEPFLPIAGQNDNGMPLVYYGGDQAWYRTHVGSVSGCGAVAAADVFAYLALTDPALAGLYDGDAAALTQDVFLRHMDDVIRFVRPSSIPGTDIPYGGLTSIPRFARYSEDFAESRGVRLRAVYLDHRAATYEQAVAAVREQLMRDNPVVMLNMANNALKSIEHLDAEGQPAVSDLRYHWVVLTALEYDGSAVTATASSEGYRVQFDFAAAWTCGAGSALGWRGIVYFLTGGE